MFYQFDDDIVSVELSELKDNALTVGYVGYNELVDIYKQFNLPLQAVEMCRESGGEFSSGVEIYDDCCFAKLGILGDDMELSSTAGIFAVKNLILIVNISDKKFMNRDLFMNMMSRVCNDNASIERLLISFFECLVVIDEIRLDNMLKNISELEETVINNSTDEQFNVKLLEIKRKILSYRGYYERLIDISQVLTENDNDLFDDSIKRFSRFIDKVKRLKDSVDILTDSVVHLWDAYQASLDMRLNETMKFFTLVTTIFFPLTVIVGWYGMNFSSMPEYNWKYGYVYVIVFSILVILLLILWFKKKKWL